MAEEPSTSQAQNPVAGAAARMKKNGMSTRDILEALFQSKLTASNQLTSLTDVILVDAQAAQVKAELKDLVTTREKETKKITHAIQAEIDYIGATKSTQQFHGNFNQQFTPLVEQQAKLMDDRKKLNEECKQIIQQLHHEIKTLGDDATINQQAFLAKIRPIKTTIEGLNKATHRLIDQNISLAHAAENLHRDTARVAATAGGFKPPVQTPDADYLPGSPD